MWVKISDKNHQFFRFEISLPQASKQKETYFVTRIFLQNFEGHYHWHCRHILSHLQFFKVCEIMVSKYGHLILPSGTFPDKVSPDIDFADEALVQCDVTVLKILL